MQPRPKTIAPDQRAATNNHALRVRTGAKAGMIGGNHGLRVRTGAKAGAQFGNHGLRVRTGAKAGAYALNHTLRVRTGAKAGQWSNNHNQVVKASKSGLKIKSNVKAGCAPPSPLSPLHEVRDYQKEPT